MSDNRKVRADKGFKVSFRAHREKSFSSLESPVFKLNHPKPRPIADRARFL
jgi:hypothetical protein